MSINKAFCPLIILLWKWAGNIVIQLIVLFCKLIFFNYIIGIGAILFFYHGGNGPEQIGDERFRTPNYSPVKTGLRFSIKARRPSA